MGGITELGKLEDGTSGPNLIRYKGGAAYVTFILAFQSLGVIYGDIGTSPLYVLNGIFPSTGDVPIEVDIIGVVSAIFWSLTLVPLIKYAFIAVEFGTNRGEGGPFALYTELYPRTDEDGDDIATLTTYDTKATHFSHTDKIGPLRRVLDKGFIQWTLLAIALFAVGLTISDGLLTPAVSVTSAVAGIAVAAPTLTNDITPVSIAILVILFLAQRFGTAKIGSIFAPIVFVWFLLLMGTGIYNISRHPAIFRAIDPSRAIMYFIRTGNFQAINGILLAITGCETMFANLGQFSKSSIRIGFAGMTFPAVALAYLGQGAALIDNGSLVLPNVFYNSIPGNVDGPLYWIVFVFAVLATIIASQAIITATFSLVVQLTAFKAMPSIRIQHTSDHHSGHVYVPAANWLLMIGTVALVGAFNDQSSNLTNAYGLAVSGVLMCTTVFVALTMVERNGWPWLLGLTFFVIYIFSDGLYFGSALFKVPHGAWFPLSLGCLLSLMFIMWAWAKGLETSYARLHRIRLSTLLAPYKVEGGGNTSLEDEDDDAISPSDNFQTLTLHPDPTGSDAVPEVAKSEKSDSSLARWGGSPALRLCLTTSGSSKSNSVTENELARLPVFAMFHKTTAGNSAPASFETFIRSYPALPRVTIFLHLKTAADPNVAPSDRLTVNRIRTVEGFYTATIRFGFRDNVDLRDVTDPLIEKIIELEGQVKDGRSADRVANVRFAARSAATHFIPAYRVRSARPDHPVNIFKLAISKIRSFLLDDIYSRLSLIWPESDTYDMGDSAHVIQIGVPATV